MKQHCATLSKEIVNELLRYDPRTGLLYWRSRDLHWFNGDRAKNICATWNARYAGRQAFNKIDKNGYKRGAIFDTHYFSHRIIWLMFYGTWPDTIDHINGIRTDNRIENLRSVPREENVKLAVPRTHARNISGTKWVYVTPLGKFSVARSINGKVHRLGVHSNLEDAVAAINKAGWGI